MAHYYSKTYFLSDFQISRQWNFLTFVVTYIKIKPYSGRTLEKKLLTYSVRTHSTHTHTHTYLHLHLHTHTHTHSTQAQCGAVCLCNCFVKYIKYVIQLWLRLLCINRNNSLGTILTANK